MIWVRTGRGARKSHTGWHSQKQNRQYARDLSGTFSRCISLWKPVGLIFPACVVQFLSPGNVWLQISQAIFRLHLAAGALQVFAAGALWCEVCTSATTGRFTKGKRPTSWKHRRAVDASCPFLLFELWYTLVRWNLRLRHLAQQTQYVGVSSRPGSGFRTDIRSCPAVSWHLHCKNRLPYLSFHISEVCVYRRRGQSRFVSPRSKSIAFIKRGQRAKFERESHFIDCQGIILAGCGVCGNLWLVQG